MLFKVLFLVAALNLHNNKAAPLNPALLFCIPTLLISLFYGEGFLVLLFGGVIMFCVSYVYFGLLTKFNTGIEYFAIMVLGAAVLLLFI